MSASTAIASNSRAPRRKAIEKEIYSGYYFEPMLERCSVTIEGLEAGTTYDVTVTPLNVWLAKGAPIIGQFTADAE